MDPIRVLIADDHTLVRAGIRVLLLGLEGVEVVAEAGDGREALALVEAHRPDILLTDIAMPHMSGLELAGHVAQAAVYAGDHPEHARHRGVRQPGSEAGAAGYLLKNSGAAELEIAVRAVARDETYLSPAVSKHVIANYLSRMGGAPSGVSPLTPRQREILQLVAEGLTTRAIASRLAISAKTVETHRTHLMDRLGIHDLAGLVRYAIRVGLIEPDR